MFDVLGLAPLSEEVYRALLHAPNRTIGALATELGESKDRLEGVIASLKDSSLVRESTERLGARGRFRTAVRAMERGWL